MKDDQCNVGSLNKRKIKNINVVIFQIILVDYGIALLNY